MLLVLILLSLLALNDAKVSFKNAMLFDEFDLNGVQEIPLEKCTNGGCSLYVSASDQAMEATKNIYIYDTEAKTNESLYNYASGYDPATGKMKGIHRAGKSYTIQNSNTDDIGPIVIYHVASQTPYYESEYVEFFDGSRMNRPDKATPYVVILTPDPYDLFVSSTDGTFMQAYIRATGIDNNNQKQSSDDNCQLLADLSGPFQLHINSPIITVSFIGGDKSRICAKPNANNGALLDYAGMATSQGYVGCEKNGWQVFRSSAYKSTLFDIHDSNNVERPVNIYYAVNTKMSDKVILTNYFNGGPNSFTISGDNQSQLRTGDRAYKISVELVNNYASSYLVKYTPQTTGSPPTGEGVCPNYVAPTTPVTTVSPTSSTLTPTTTGANDMSVLLGIAASILFAVLF